MLKPHRIQQALCEATAGVSGTFFFPQWNAGEEFCCTLSKWVCIRLWVTAALNWTFSVSQIFFCHSSCSEHANYCPGCDITLRAWMGGGGTHKNRRDDVSWRECSARWVIWFECIQQYLCKSRVSRLKQKNTSQVLKIYLGYMSQN